MNRWKHLGEKNKLKITTGNMYERVVRVISKDQISRTKAEVDVILPWLRKKSQLLNKMDKNVIISIIQNCVYQVNSKDDVVIKQGETGDSFFIILNGLVGVYIDSKKSGEDKPPPAEVPDKSKTEEEKAMEQLFGKQKKKLDKSKYGKCVVQFGGGKSFGELALIEPEAKRNATIICHEDTDFLVIHRELYNSTLKAFQEADYRDRHTFVETNPLFKKWPKKLKQLLKMSFIKELYSYDTKIVKQGDPIAGLHFIRRGQAKLVIEHARHDDQYMSMWPFHDSHDMFDLENIKRPKKAKEIRDHPRVGTPPARQHHVEVRRFEGYAAAEKLEKNKVITMCTMEEGEVVGDIEYINDLQTYHGNVICTVETEVYFLNWKNFDRLISKKNASTVASLRQGVICKLQSRAYTIQGDHVPLLRHLLFKMTDEQKPVQKKIPPLRTSKDLPEKDLLQAHLVEAFQNNRAEILAPFVPGSVYLREMMRDKAKIRESQHANKVKAGRAREKKKNKEQRKPRSLRQLREALMKRDMQEKAVNSEVASRFMKAVVNAQLAKGRPEQTADERVAEFEQRLAEMNYKPSGSPNSVKDDDVDSEGEIRDDDTIVSMETHPNNPKEERINSPNKLDLRPISEENTELLLLERIAEEAEAARLKSAPKSRLASRGKSRGQSRGLSGGRSRNHSRLASRGQSRGKSRGNSGAHSRLSSTKSMRSRVSDSIHLPSINHTPNSLVASEPLPLTRDDTHLTFITQSIIAQQEMTAKSEQAPSEAGTSISKMTGMTNMTGTSSVKRRKRKLKKKEIAVNALKQSPKMKFINAYVQTKIQHADKFPDFRDFETSDKTLSYLEKRLQNFHLRLEENIPHEEGRKLDVPILPRLKRYVRPDAILGAPKPGGKVLLKKQGCRFADSEFPIKHEHTKYHIVDTLPNYRQLEKTRYYMTLFMDNAMKAVDTHNPLKDKLSWN
ncbi:unnamed protein product [Owenia fusiformis]|uniref:Uncharacterized protein n=1 Tax=Owenia fusiformis TaxID=6347 RepID=A0A8J1Y3Z3_OWEFU|nr:unnamed protein product [Owenia fusiformis]